MLLKESKISIPIGFYPNAAQLVLAINASYKKVLNGDGRKFFTYDRLQKRTRVEVCKDCILDFNDSDIGRYLGFEKNTHVGPAQSKQSDFMSMHKNGLNLMYVYSDIV